MSVSHTPEAATGNNAQMDVEEPIFWISPFAPKDSAAWPDSPNKTFWIGPFDRRSWDFAKIADEGTAEPVHLRELRKLAEIHQSDGDYAGARFCWASIAEHYMELSESAPFWTPRPGFCELKYKPNERSSVENRMKTVLGSLNIRSVIHRMNTALGGIINTYFAQHSSFSSITDIGKETCLYYIVEEERGYEDPTPLYITRVVLQYCSSGHFQPDLERLCKAYRQVVSIAEPIHGSNHPDIVHLLQGTAKAIKRYEHFYTMKCPTHWIYEAEGLLLRALSRLQALYGSSSLSSMNFACELATLYETIHEPSKAESTLREAYKIAKRVLGEEHDQTI